MGCRADADGTNDILGKYPVNQQDFTFQIIKISRKTGSTVNQSINFPCLQKSTINIKS